ncbi:MAG: hypothetical protein SFY69_06415 [Planctomycetota bacterium]|nr:hypothetical protein [Planctomycetota bacterium]
MIDAEVQSRLEAARAMYARVMCAWAQDLLELRRTGRDIPRRASARRVLAFPSRGTPVASEMAEADTSLLRWRPQRRAA